MSDIVHLLRTKIRNDLREAMKSHETITVSVLRSLLAALDNGEAIPISSEHLPSYGHSNEVARKTLTKDECFAIINTELLKRSNAVLEFEELDLQEQAQQSRVEASIVKRYLGA